MYYLDDDFHDELTHFCAAAERFRINSGQIEAAIKLLSVQCNSTRVHEPEHYYSWQPGGRRTSRGPRAAVRAKGEHPM